MSNQTKKENLMTIIPTLGFPIMVMIDYNIKYQGGFTQCKDTILFLT